MKKLLFLLLLVSVGAKAQFFSQQATQRKLMAAQISGYQVYLNLLNKGYQISQGGWQSALELKDSSYDHHKVYFLNLKSVGGSIQTKNGDSVIAQIRKVFDLEWAFQQKEKRLNAKELSYFQRVRDRLLADAETEWANLADLQTSGKLDLSDAERQERIDKVFASLQDKLAFAGAFTRKSHQLTIARKRARAEQEQIRKLYGL